jgi:uncharacterized protein (TIGR02246 family)
MLRSPQIPMTPEQQGVADANDVFYRALSERDLTVMAEVWFPADWAECVHPGSTAIRGWDAVRESWRSVFGADATVTVTPGDVRVRIVGDVAWASCVERIAAAEGDEIHSSLAQATNVFVRHDGRWRLVVHHASPVPYMPPPTPASGSLVN